MAPEGVEIPTCNSFSTRKGISPHGDDPVKRESPERVFLGPAKFRSEVDRLPLHVVSGGSPEASGRAARC